MMKENRDDIDDPHIGAARAALIALRATVPAPENVSGDCYIFLPDGSPYPMSEAVQILRRMPKPVSCVALGFGSALALACWPIPADEARRAPDFRALLTRQLFKQLQQQEQPRAPHSGGQNVVLKGYGETVALTLTEAELLMCDYIFAVAASSLDTDSDELGEFNAVGILTVGPPEPGTARLESL